MKRPRSLTLAGLLSIIQGAGLMALCGLGVQHLVGSDAFAALVTQVFRAAPSAELQYIAEHFGELVTVGLLPTMWLIFGLGTLIAGLGLLRLQVGAWLGSLVMEGMILAWSLLGYIGDRANIIDYITMALAIVIVLFLNQLDTQLAFQEQRKHLEERMGR